jgi:WD40 repeat protein
MNQSAVMDADDPELELAEEADLSLNASLADSQSTFGDSRYHDFDGEKSKHLPGLRAGGDDVSEERYEATEEPRLKYDRLSSDLKDILANDAASAIAVHPKFLVIGTQWGRLYLLDALGHTLPQSQSHFARRSHSVAVSQIAVDHAGEFVASSSTDGRVIITGLYTRDSNHSLTTGKPVHSVALDPIFARPGSGKRFMTGDDDRVILHEKTYFNRYKQVNKQDFRDYTH